MQILLHFLKALRFQAYHMDRLISLSKITLYSNTQNSYKMSLNLQTEKYDMKRLYIYRKNICI